MRAVVSTNALELGIDIGALDVVGDGGLSGHDRGDVAARRARGPARSSRSAAVMVASSAPLDQFVVRNPSYFFDASPERALIDPDNLHILVDHIKCAAFELPFSDDGGVRPPRRAGDSRRPGRAGARAPIAAETSRRAATERSGPGRTSRIRPTPSACGRSRRTTSSSSTRREEPRVIGETDFTSGPATLHPKAIYIVEGKLYQVERLDFEGRKAFVREIDCDYYTDAITYTRVTVLDTFADDAISSERDGRQPVTASGGPP